MSNIQWKIIFILPVFLLGYQLVANADLGVNETPILPAPVNVSTTNTVDADFELNGSGTDVDSIAFWETPNADDVLMFTTSKGSQLVEVWQFPFVNNEQTPLTHSTFGSSGTRVNGVVVDQDRDLLYVSVSSPQSTVAVFSLPNLVFSSEFISGTFDLKSEPNIDLLSHSNGETWAYVSADQILYIYNAVSGDFIDQFQPVKGLETVLADDLHQIIYVPDEKGQTGVYAYHPDGTPYLKNGSNQFGTGVFQSDAEGITLYHCPPIGRDNGTGFIVVSDQIGSQTEFEFFDRQSWDHLGTLLINGVSNTDGIASTQQALPGYPLGIFAAINSDTSTVGVGWDKVFAAMGIACDDSPAVQELQLGAGWNMISSYVDPLNPDLEVMLAEIKDDMVLIKNGAGEVYWPGVGNNIVDGWNVLEGYKIYMTVAATLSITGTPVIPESTPIDLEPGWNMIAYLRDSPMTSDQALTSIAGDFLLIKNNAGEVYWPDMAPGQTIDMLPGQGYQIYMNNAATLVYPAN